MFLLLLSNLFNPLLIVLCNLLFSSFKCCISLFSLPSLSFDLVILLKEIVNKYNNKNIIFESNKKIYFDGRKNLIERCINNLINNSEKYGKKIIIKVETFKSNIIIFIEDDGPGINEKEFENVFKPFYKIDKGRTEVKSSVGLGLSIASDIIRSHGGEISLGKSTLGGLKVKIFLPF